MTNIKTLLCLVLTGLTWNLACAANYDTLYVDGSSSNKIHLDHYFSYYIDSTGSLSERDILSLAADKWKTTNGESLRLDVTEAHIWLALSIQGGAEQGQYTLSFKDPSLYSITLYEYASDSFLVSHSGASIPQRIKDVAGNKNKFSITIPKEKHVDLYFEIMSKTSMTLSATIQESSADNKEHLTETIVLGAFYGMAALLVFFSFFLFVTTRDQIFIWYGLYVISVTGFTSIADGFFTMLPVNLAVLFKGYHDIFFFILSSVFGLIFMIKFLKINLWHSRFYKAVVVYLLVLFVIIITAFFISKSLLLHTAEFFGLINLILFIVGGVLAVRKGIDQSRYYLGAFVAFGIFVIIFILSQFRVIPFSGLVQYAIHIGYALSILILSYGLTARLYLVYQKLVDREREKKHLIAMKNRELEEMVRLRTAAIKKKEINLRTILDNNDQSIWLVDTNYRLIDFNTLFDFRWRQTYGSHLERGENILEIIPDADLTEKWKRRYDDAFAGNSRQYYDTYETNEQTYWFEIKSYPISENGKVTGVSLFVNDITDRLNAERQLKNQNEMLKKVNKELDSFVYSASHDLKAPLASVMGLINLVKAENDLEARLQYYEMMEQSVARLDQFIKDIIDYSRNERTEPQYEKINMQTVINEVLNDLKYLDGSQQIMKKVTSSQPVDFICDPIRFKVALRNLISNAIRYGCSNENKKQIDISAIVDNKECTVKIRDYGSGIEEKHIDHIFEMFYRAQENATGTGLGLYIVKETIGKLKGTVSVQSGKQGTVFTVVLPNYLSEK